MITINQGVIASLGTAADL